MSKIQLTQITADQRAQPRTAIEMDKVEEYAADMLRGDKFPACVVFFDQKTYWLADGFHRYYAATSAELTSLHCEVRPGTLRNAILFSCGANAQHGFRRTNEDKRRAVMRLLADADWAKWSDEEVARHCAVEAHLVAKIKKDMKITLESQGDKVIYKDRWGNVGTMNTANLGRRAKEDSAWLAKSLHEIERHIDMMPDPHDAVADFPQAEHYAFPYSKLVQMAVWMTEFAEQWRVKIANKARANESVQ